MILRQGLIFATLLSSLIALPTLAMEDNANDEARTPNLEEDENLSPTPDEALDAKAIRASIVNGVIDVLENTKRARIDLTWDMLPLTQSGEFKQQALSEARKNIGLPETETDTQAPCGPQGMMTITIANEDIGTSIWLDKLTDEEKICLQDAFALEGEDALNNIIDEPPLPGEDATFDPNSNFRKAFRDFWIRNSNRDTNSCGQSEFEKQGYANRPGCGRALIENITVPEYYRMLREYFIVTDLFRTKGIAYSLDLNGIEASMPGDTTLVPYQGKSAYIFYQGIDWKIDIVRRPVSEDFNVSYYRFGAKAVTRKPIEFQFRNDSNPTASIAMSFRQSDITFNIDDLYPDKAFEINSQSVISDEVKQQLGTIKSKQGLSQLDIPFASITGISASQVVSRKFLGGANNTSFIGGGLIGNDEIQSLVGANLEIGKFAEDLVPGLLFGLSPRDEDATLFLGPSLRFSIFTLAAGARLFEFDDGVRVRPAGVVSLDLSRVLNGNQSQNIPVEDPNFGGGWFDFTGIVAEDLSENIALIGYTLKQESGINLPDDSIKLFRNSQPCDAQNLPSGCQPTNLPSIEQNIEIGLKFNNLEEINFLPKGIYSLKSPDNYVVKDCNSNQTVTEISSLATEGNPFVQQNWKVVKQENVSLPISCN